MESCKSFRYVKDKSVQIFNKVLVQLLPTCLDVLRRKIKFFIELKRALRIVYDDHNSSHSELRMTKNERTIHQQNINVLMKFKSLKTIYLPS